MKKALIILLIFTLFTILVCNVQLITKFDEEIIRLVQQKMNISSQFASILSGKKLYYTILYSPIIAFSIYFVIKKLYWQIPVIIASPLVSYIFNFVFKNIIARPRPSIELQIGTHSNSFSYVSNHTLILACLWGMVIFYTCKYSKNNILKYIIIIIATFVIILSGFSRILLGVHNPSDVIGAYILASLFIVLYIQISNVITKRFEK